MLGLAFKNSAGMAAPGVRFGRGVRPTQSHVRRTGGTAKPRAKWALVSPVPPVSPNLELIEDNRMGKQDRQRQGLVGPLPAHVRQVGQGQQPCGFKVRPLWWNTGETGGTVQPCHPVKVQRCKGAKVQGRRLERELWSKVSCVTEWK